MFSHTTFSPLYGPNRALSGIKAALNTPKPAPGIEDWSISKTSGVDAIAAEAPQETRVFHVLVLYNLQRSVFWAVTVIEVTAILTNWFGKHENINSFWRILLYITSLRSRWCCRSTKLKKGFSHVSAPIKLILFGSFRIRLKMLHIIRSIEVA